MSLDYKELFVPLEKQKESLINFHIKRLQSSCKSRAKKLGLDFDLDREWIDKKIRNGICEITGIEFDYETEIENTRPFIPSIYRITPSSGYVKSNCQMVIWAFNMAKNEMSYGVLYFWTTKFIEWYEKQIENNKL